MRRTRTAFPGLALVSAIVVSLVAGLVARETVAQDDATTIGVPEPGEVAWGLIGRSDRGEQDTTYVGFLTAVAGAEDDLLFTNPESRTAESARFTFAAELASVSTAEVETVRAETLAGTLTVFYAAEPGADFGDPSSFAAGTPVASFDLRAWEIVSDQSAASTLVVSSGELVQTDGEAFEHDGESFRFGFPDARLLMTLTGIATGDDESDPAASVLAGYAELTGSASQTAPTDATDEPDEGPDEEEPTEEDDEEPAPPSPGATGEGCDAILPWFETTSSQVADVEVLVEFLLGVESVEDLEAEQLRAAADALAALADQQRAVELPDEAVEARDAIADAMAAIGETIVAIADAVEAANSDDFEAALANLDAALDDLRAAQADAEAIAGACAEG